MGKEIEWSRITWNDDDDFIAFAFGDFDSKSMGIIRTSQSNRYEEHLSAPTKDLTAEVPGGDGQYYFGTNYQPKVFNINFAFDNLTKRQIRELKRVFSGKEMRELAFAEDYNRIYMAKVTSQPNLKTLCFDIDGEEIYKGEGTVQFTAYWPYARENSTSVYTAQVSTSETTILVENEGDIPATFTFTAPVGTKVNEIKVIQDSTTLTTIKADGITEWNSKTGILKYGEDAISYTGDGLVEIPLGLCTFVITSGAEATGDVNVEFYNWYY